MKSQTEGKGIKHTEDNLVKSYKKPKELDWAEKILGDYGKITGIYHVDGAEYNVDEKQLISFIKSILTQQRTELLEEIKTRIDTWGGFEDDGGNLCHYDSEILEWVNDLLNKKLLII